MTPPQSSRKSSSPNYINHIALALDMSASMHYAGRELVKVADGIVAHLARRSQELDQETRVTIYTFNHEVRCVVYDKDVLRLPSIKDFYDPDGMTALIDATIKAQDDLAQTAQLYGDHAFLTYVLTDGQENKSKASSDDLRDRLHSLPENWTVAVLVPDQHGVFEAKSFGFPADNIAVWDAQTAAGVTEVGEVIRRATDTYMDNRTKGIRGSKSIFAGGTDAINRQTIKASQGFRQLPKDAYRLLDVKETAEIRPWVERETGETYRPGSAYYQLMKPEKIQPQKQICVRNRKSGRVYSGDKARALLNLPDTEVRVKPEGNPEYQIFVQSTSVNRKLVPGTKLLILN